MSPQQWLCPRCRTANPIPAPACSRCGFSAARHPTVTPPAPPPGAVRLPQPPPGPPPATAYPPSVPPAAPAITLMPAKRAFPWGWTAACAAIALVFFGLGWWAGRERLVYEMRDAFSKAFQAPDFGSAASETARKTIKVTVNQVSVSPTLLMTSRYSFRSGPSAETPSETGHVWMRCRVTVVNGGSQRVSIEPDDFELVGLNRNVYRAVDHSDRSVPDVNFLTATLLPGGTASGDLLFSIPPGVNPERVECTAD